MCLTYFLARLADEWCSERHQSNQMLGILPNLACEERESSVQGPTESIGQLENIVES